jgi:hypothetical protein
MTTAVRLVSVLTGFLLTVSRVGATDIPISIESLATDHYVGVLPTLPTGTVVFGGVTFDLPSTRPLWTSNGAFSIPPDLIATQTVSAAGVQAVHLLLNTGNTYASQMSVGQQIGSVILDFSTGDASVTPLLVGVNIRDAAPGTTAQPVIGTITDPNVQQVWSGLNNNGILEVIDMLTIPVTNSSTLTQIILDDQSIALIGQTNPALSLKGMTITEVPEPEAFWFVLCGLSFVGCLVRSKQCR